jgi:hypothetical protein
MVSASRAVFASFCMLALLAPAGSLAQAPPPSPPPPFPGDAQPVPVLPQTIAVPPTGQLPPPTGQAVAPIPPPPALAPVPPPLAQAPGGEPLIYRPELKCGFFAAFELSVLAPSIGGHQFDVVKVAGINQNVSLPFTGLDWTGSPRIELGYCFGDMGCVIGAYRSVVSQGSADLDGFDPTGTAFLHTRLNLNSVDLMYASPTYALGTLWDLKWDAGLRIGAVYYDSQANGPILSQHVTNNFVGAGPRAGIEVRRYLEDAPGISVFGRLETGFMIGGDSQSYSETVQLGGGASVSGSDRFSATRAVPMLGLQLGVSYSPPQNPRWLRLSAGYEFEEWWGVGGAGGNSGNVQFQGLFFRGEFHY